MSLIGQLLKGILSGAGWTAGKKLADDGIEMIQEKYKEHQSKKEKGDTGEDALEKMGIPEEEEEEEDINL